jgi:hypothetical protein
MSLTTGPCRAISLTIPVSECANEYAYVDDDPINGNDPLGVYKAMDFGGDALSFAAGLGNAVSFGGSSWIAAAFWTMKTRQP